MRGRQGIWKRKHTEWRQELFTPAKVNKGPKDGDKIGRYRITEGVDEDGNKFVIVDNWAEVDNPHRNLGKSWRGMTTFAMGA